MDGGWGRGGRRAQADDRGRGAINGEAVRQAGGARASRVRGAAVPAGRGWRGRGREPEDVSLLSSAAAAAVVVVGEPEGSSKRVSGMINHVWQRRGRRTRCALGDQHLPYPCAPLAPDSGLFCAEIQPQRRAGRGGPCFA